MKRLFLIPLVIVLVSGLIFTACAAPAPAPAPAPVPTPAPAPAPVPAPAPPEVKPIELRFTHHSSPMAKSHTDGYAPWARKVEEVTNGRVKVTIYPAQTLASVTETFPATKAGVADIGAVLLGMYPGRFPLTEVTALPFVNLPSGTVDGRTLGDGGINSHILQELYETFPEMQAEWGEVKVLFLFTTAPFQLMTKANKPVRNQADLKGMKIRTLAGPPLQMWKLLGAIPISMPLPAAYEAAEKGVVEGAMAEWGGLMSYRLYEVLHYMTMVDLTVMPWALAMNKEKWNSLPPDIQEAIMSVSGMYGAEFIGPTLGATIEQKNAYRASVKKEGYEVEEVDLDPGELEKWIEISGKPTWDKWVADMEAKGLPGQKLFDEAFRLIEKYK